MKTEAPREAEWKELVAWSKKQEELEDKVALDTENLPDSVNHPVHYTSSKSKCAKCNEPIECIQITEQFQCNLSNVIKYCWRANLKGGLEDLKKAHWYLSREISRLS